MTLIEKLDIVIEHKEGIDTLDKYDKQDEDICREYAEFKNSNPYNTGYYQHMLKPKHSFEYVNLEDALRIYNKLCLPHGDLRDKNNLIHALCRPQIYTSYICNEDYDDIAIFSGLVLAEGVAMLHPFIDGNKRMALLLMMLHYKINGIHIPVSSKHLAFFIIMMVDTSVHQARLCTRILTAIAQHIDTLGEDYVNT